MPSEYPLYRLRPEDAARLILMLPSQPVVPRKFEHKREMRSRPSPRSQPSNQDINTWVKADHGHYWDAYKQDEAKEFPRIGVLLGPMLKNGQFFSPERIEHPLLFERQREPMEWGIYSKAQYESEIEHLEAARALLRENFILGQRNEGPYLDGLVYMRADEILLAEELRCTNRLRMTWAIMQQRRARKAAPAAKKEVWRSVGNDETVAMKFKQSGYDIRKVDTLTNRRYEVKMK